MQAERKGCVPLGEVRCLEHKLWSCTRGFGLPILIIKIHLRSSLEWLQKLLLLIRLFAGGTDDVLQAKLLEKSASADSFFSSLYLDVVLIIRLT